MYSPDVEAFAEMMEQAGLVPLHRTIIADLDTPLTIFAKVADGKKDAFLLESLQGGEKWGRFSFIGFDPVATFKSNGSSYWIEKNEGAEEFQGDPIEGLKVLIDSFSACNTDYLPRFFGGAVGYMGYDMVRFMEKLPKINKELEDFPDSSFIL